MIFTEADKAKLTSNIEEIVTYIKENIQPKAEDEIEVNFGGRHISIRTGSATDVYHLRVTPERIEYAIKFGNYLPLGKDAVIAYPRDMLEFVKNWFDIKCRLNTAVANQDGDRKAIHDFKI